MRHNYKNLKIWQLGILIANDVSDILLEFPKHERYDLSSQLSRCSVSIPSNIAEGNSRNSEKDKKRYIEIALGSAYELETQVIISINMNFSDNIVLENLVLKIREEQKLMSSFINKLSE